MILWYHKRKEELIMNYYVIMTAAGFLALLFAYLLAEEECTKRHKLYEQRLHTQLVLFDAPDRNLACTLYRTNNVLGRRKRRSDICLACFKDGRISRNHAILSYDGENFHIKPVFRLKSFRHTEIIVENELVPPQGRIIRYGDRISIAGHMMQLENTNNGETGWSN